MAYDSKEKQNKYMREYYKMLKDNGIPRLTDEQRIEYNLRRKERYANDPEYRARVMRENKRSAEKRKLKQQSNEDI